MIDNVYQRAIDKWGNGHQMDMATEEAAEVIQAIIHYKRGRCGSDVVCGELADLQIMIEQMKLIFGPKLFAKIFNEKLEALRNKLGDS